MNKLKIKAISTKKNLMYSQQLSQERKCDVLCDIYVYTHTIK